MWGVDKGVSEGVSEGVVRADVEAVVDIEALPGVIVPGVLMLDGVGLSSPSIPPRGT